MPLRPRSAGVKAMLAAVVLILFFLSPCVFAQETVLHSFNDHDGNEPIGGVTFDSAGSLYGTTFYGGSSTVGVVYQLKPSSAGNWKEKVLHTFSIDGTDGYWTPAGLTLDSAGNLYGVTWFGGTADEGIVYKLSPNSDGSWTETILHNFVNDGTDGFYPHSSVILDAQGNLYGTTANGGAGNYGVVYELSPSGGTWTETILHTFANTEGANPFGSLVFDAAGNLYGATSAGGGSSSACKYGCGTIFELSPSAGSWNVTVLHNFTTNPRDGRFPYCALVFDSGGNLYGMTSEGGSAGNYGTVFELTPSGNSWKETILHVFNRNGTDGYYPFNGLIIDAAGNLYGTTQTGGFHGQGIAFELTPSNGTWNEKILYNFNPQGRGGYDPVARLVFDSAGNLYGTAISGGAYSKGTVFEIKP